MTIDVRQVYVRDLDKLLRYCLVQIGLAYTLNEDVTLDVISISLPCLDGKKCHVSTLLDMFF